MSAQAHAADGGRGGAVHRHRHQQDGQRAGGLSVRRLPGPVPRAWKSGLKGLATYRPNAVLGAVLSARRAGARSRRTATRRRQPPPRARARCRQPVLSVLRWPGRPELAAGNPAWTYMIEHPSASFALFVGERATNGTARAAAVRGVGQRRRAAARPGRAGQDAVDGHARQRRGVAAAQARRARHGGRATTRSRCRSRRTASGALFPGVVAAFARGDPLALRAARRAAEASDGGRRRCSTRCSASRSRSTGTDGTMAWTVDVVNPRTGDDFVLTLKEIMLPDADGAALTRPYSMWLVGQLPARARRPVRACCRSTCA